MQIRRKSTGQPKSLRPNTTSHEPYRRIYRLVLGISGGLLLVQVAMLYRNRIGQALAAEQKIPPAAIGDTLRNVTLNRGTVSDAASKGTQPLLSLIGARCGLIVFFDSNCPICRAMADDWSGRSVLAVGSDSLPISWVAIRAADDSAASFIQQHGLPSQWYSLKSDGDRAALGVFGTPIIYVVDRNRVLRQNAGRDPAEVKKLPAECTDQKATT